MSKQIYINFYKKPMEFITVDKKFWCLWNPAYLELFHRDAEELIKQLTKQVDEIHSPNTWSEWDLFAAGFSLGDYDL